MYADNSKKKEAKKHNGSRNEITEVDAVIDEVKRELRSLLVRTDEQIKRLGNALKNVVKREESICEEIKIALKEEIAEGVISNRTIELHCPTEWKHKTRPKNEKISFSKQLKEKPPQQIAAMQEGKSVTINEITSNTKASDGINQQQLHDPSVRNAIPANDNNEVQIAMTNQRKSDELKANADISLKANADAVDSSAAMGAIRKLPSYPSDKQIGKECTSCLELQDQVTQLKEALQRISVPTADQIPVSEFDFIIPKEKYEMVIDAMDESESAIFVKCDWSKRFVRAVPDVDN